MTANEYQQLALRTESKFGNETDRLLQGLMGLCGESGECIDLFKKHYCQGHHLDLVRLAKELGDVAWYLAISANAIGYSLDEIFEMNIEKLGARYPNGFDPEKSMNRGEGDV